MNTTFERTENTTDEWYTPKEIIDALGPFDTESGSTVLTEHAAEAPDAEAYSSPSGGATPRF